MYWGMGRRARNPRDERGGGSVDAGRAQGKLLRLHDAICFHLVYGTIPIRAFDVACEWQE
jgi:hypothetical protein